MLADRASIYFQKIEGQLYIHYAEAVAYLEKLLNVGDLVIFFKNYVFDINLFWRDCCNKILFHRSHHVIPPVAALNSGIGCGIAGIKTDVDFAAAGGKHFVNPGRMSQRIGMHVLKVVMFAQPAACGFKIRQQGGFSPAPAYGAVFFQCVLLIQALYGGENGNGARVLSRLPQVAVDAAAVADVSVVIQGKNGKSQLGHTDRMRKGNKIGAARTYLGILLLHFLRNAGDMAGICLHIHRAACKRKIRYNDIVRIAAGLQGPFFKHKFPNKPGAE